MTNSLRIASLLSAALLLAAPALNGQQWTAPTAEELSTTSISEVPGAPAFYLYLERTTDDSMRTYTYYTRVKILTDGGKDQANIEIPFSGTLGMSVDSVVGRTIHADGTIVPFTGKPYEKLVEKSQGEKLKVKVFTMPSVEVGSILEYRYKLHYDDYYFLSPDWYIQNELFIRSAHYSWRPSGYFTSGDGTEVSIAWTPILPVGVTLTQNHLIKASSESTSKANTEITLDMHNVPPLPKEDNMPPIGSLSYRVLFYYTRYRSGTEFWNKEGKLWSKDRDKFIGPGSAVQAAVKEAISPGDSQDQKLRKLYALVMTFENTDFTRERSTREEHANGLKDVSNADDILKRKRGTGDQLTELFVSMARAAGFKAYVMAVSNRDERIFLPAYLSLRQLDDLIAIVNIDGKEQTFDPGQRYCAYNQLAWKHTYAGGLRQTENGTEITGTGSAKFKDEHTSRVADLVLDEHGEATGTVTLAYTGDAALRWRQEGLRGDDTSLNADLKTNLEHMLPGGMEVRVTKVENLTDPEKPLQVVYEIKGAVGSSTGKRLLVPGSLFEVNSETRFPAAKRELAVDMHYPHMVQDAVRFKLPASITIESAPPGDKGVITGSAAYTTSTKLAADSITLYRNVTIANTIYLPTEYPDLKNFYGKLEAKDKETLVLTRAPLVATKAGSGSN